MIVSLWNEEAGIAATRLQEDHKVSEQRACLILEQNRQTQRIAV